MTESDILVARRYSGLRNAENICIAGNLFHYVSDVADSADEVFSEFFPKGGHVRFERDGIESEGFFGFTPDGLQYFGFVFRDGAVLREEFEDSPFFGRQVEDLSVFRYFHTFEVDSISGDFHCPFDRLFPTAGYRSNSGDELFGFERFRQIVVRPGIERFDFVDEERVRSQC